MDAGPDLDNPSEWTPEDLAAFKGVFDWLYSLQITYFCRKRVWGSRVHFPAGAFAT